MTTRVYRDHWKQLHAETKIPLGFSTKEGEAILTLSTRKSDSGKLYTHASVDFHSEGCKRHSFPDDYSKKVRVADEVKRVTEKSLTEFHTESLSLSADLKTEALSHYNQ